DSSVDMKDVLVLRKYIAGMSGEINLVAADVNGDSSVDMKDVLMIRKYIAQLIPSLPGAGEVSGDPSEPSDDPSELPDDPSELPDDPSELPGDPSELPGDPSEPSDDPSEPSGDSSEPSGDSSEPSNDPSEEVPVSEEPISEEPENSLVAQWIDRGNFGDVGSAVFYVRSSTVGATPAGADQKWSDFFGAHNHLDKNQYLLIEIEGLPGANNAGANFEVRGFTPDGTTAYYYATNVVSATDTTMTVLVSGPVANNSNGKSDIKFSFTGLEGRIRSSQGEYDTDVWAGDITVTISLYGGTADPSTDTSDTSDTSDSSADSSTEPVNGHHYASEPTATEMIDLVTLTIADKDSKSYGISYHSFEALTQPVVQYVEGMATDTSAFASAKSVGATYFSETMKEFDNYSPSDYTFYYKWSERSKLVYDIETHVYQAKLTVDGINVKYGTTYSYRAGDPTKGYWSPIYTFTTRPAAVDSFSFIFTSDTQPDLGDNLAPLGMNMLFNKAVETAPTASFFVSGGDFVYCSDEGQGAITPWRRMINGSNANTGPAGSLFTSRPWIVANGNHDNDKVQSFFNNDTTSRSSNYYSFNYGNAHIVILDSGHTGTLSSAQLSWLENDLAANASAKWKIVALHWSFYCNDRDLKGANRDALTLFDRYGVDVCISGHNYADYYTTYPLKAGAVTTTEVTKEGDTEYYTSPGGTIYMQTASSGLGGDLKTGSGGGNSTYKYAEAGLVRDGEVGNHASFAVVRVESDRLTFDRYYLDNKTVNGSLTSTVKRYASGQFGIIK
ncbi:MAG: metallophosphoesterase, partial [Clostridia bacterium]|nr:metallophosphoesterase [Clostridia bacterium]